MSQVAQPSETGQRDCLFGVCAAIGEDFGFNADFLRVPFAALLLWNPLVLAAAYASTGMLVLLSRRLFPKPAPARPGTVVSLPARDEEPSPLREAA